MSSGGFGKPVQAARIDPRKLLTSIFSRSDCDDNPLEASINFDAAMPAWFAARVTPSMFSFTSSVPVAACWTLPTISRVAPFC